jgi:hypothetical protein
MDSMTIDGTAAPDSETVVRASTDVEDSNMDEVRDSDRDSWKSVSHHSSPTSQPGEESDPAVMRPVLRAKPIDRVGLRDLLFYRLKQNSAAWLASVLGNSPRGGFGSVLCAHLDRVHDEELMSRYAHMDANLAMIQDLKYETLKQVKSLIDYAYQHSWTEFDWRLHRAWQLESAQWTIRDWPNDCKLILKAGTVHFYLGSIAAAWHVSQGYGGEGHGIVPATVPFKCVISMNDEDEQRPGEPSRDEWFKYFEERGITNLRYCGYDERFFAPEKPGTWRWATKKAEFKGIWRKMIKDFATWWEDHHCNGADPSNDDPTKDSNTADTSHDSSDPTKDSQMVPSDVAVLVHCYGGVNRSTAALICLLMVWTGQPAIFILQLVLNEKAGAQFWQDRLYILEALLEFSEEVLCQ